MTAEIRHPDVATCEILCLGCPEEYAGTLTDGRHFYLRYRWGTASLTLAATDDPARLLGGEPAAEISAGAETSGMFRGDGERDKVFAALLDTADGLTRGETIAALHDRLTPGVTIDLPEYGLTVTRWSDR
jgi:hypothetical protein